MNPREFMILLGAATGVARRPRTESEAAQNRAGPGSGPMTGNDPDFPVARAFVHGLRDLGWIEGMRWCRTPAPSRCSSIRRA
jgi:hypothetical protein